MIRLLVILFCVCLVPFVVRKKIRDFLMPWLFSSVLLWQLCKDFVGLYIFAKFGDLVIFISYAIIINGFRGVKFGRDKLFTLITTLACYKMISCLFGDFALFNMTFDACWFLEYIAISYCMGRWIVEEQGRFQRVLAIVTVMSICIALLYWRTNIFDTTHTVADDVRFQVEYDYKTDRKSSINGIAAQCSAFLIFPFLNILWGRFTKRKISSFLLYLILLMISVAVIAVLGVIILKTGCRNAMLAIVVYGGYFLFGKWGDGSSSMRFVKRVILSLGLLLLSIRMGVTFFGEDYEFRSFDFLARSNKTTTGDITTGRTQLWVEWLDSMRDINYFFGAGAVPKDIRYWHFETGSFFVHNSYIQLFVQTGLVGSSIFLILIVAFLKKSMRTDHKTRHLVITLFLTWFVLGIAESSSFVFISSLTKIPLGLALGLCEAGFVLSTNGNVSFLAHANNQRDRYLQN